MAYSSSCELARRELAVYNLCKALLHSRTHYDVSVSSSFATKFATACVSGGRWHVMLISLASFNRSNHHSLLQERSSGSSQEVGVPQLLYILTKMAKNTGSSKFRKVNVDEFDENNYQDDIVEETQDGPDEGEVSNLLNSGKNQDALKLVLANPPVGNDKAVKEKSAALAIRVLSVFKPSEVEKGVQNLSKDEVDTLMKYIYKGFETPSDKTCGILLTWHEKAYAVGGVGSILRVLTDRKFV